MEGKIHMGFKTKFELGTVVMTRGIAGAVEDEDFFREVRQAFTRYIHGIWGDTCEADSKMNDRAVAYGNDRILASYETSHGKMFISTEYDRSYTTIMFATEY